MLGVRLDAELEEHLDDYVKTSKKKRSQVVKEALREFLSRAEEEAEHDRLTLEGWKDFQNGRVIPEAEIRRYLKSWKSR